MKKFLTTCSCAIIYAVIQAQSSEQAPVANFPNLHPLFVHIPLILLIAALIMQVFAMFRNNPMFNYTITIFMVAGFLGGLLAATVFHGHPSHEIADETAALFEKHEALGFATVWLSGIASVVKIWSLIKPNKWLESITLILLLAASTTVAIAGHRGTELVYKHGVGPKGEKLEKESEHHHDDNDEHEH